jgi:hypothetical protein
MALDECVLYRMVLAKYAAAFFKISFSISSSLLRFWSLRSSELVNDFETLFLLSLV